jgi:heat shock protein HslJ
LPGTEITALFEGGTITGSSGCNTYSAGYTINGNQITITAPSGSQIACEDDVMAQEATYLAALTNVSSYQVSGQALTLSGTANLVYNAR